MPRPPAVVGACTPFDSLLSTTQGTGTQGKTRGQDPGVRPQPAPQEEEENAVHFRLAIEADTGGGVLDIMDDESLEFHNPSDDDDNDDLFPEDIIHPSPQEKGRNAGEFQEICHRSREDEFHDICRRGQDGKGKRSRKRRPKKT